jgi:hypothetical protein
MKLFMNLGAGQTPITVRAQNTVFPEIFILKCLADVDNNR